MVRPGRGAVAAGHPSVVATVADVLGEGGNAYDGAIAGIAMACVCEPVLASLGGGGFLLAAPAEGPSVVYDFFVQTPRRRPPDPDALDFYPVHAHFGVETQEFHIGWGTAATPGLTAGLFAVHADRARMPMRDLLAPAVRAAKDGVEVTEAQASFLQIVSPIFLATEESRRLFGSRLEPGSTVRAGERLRLPAMADLLDCLAPEGPDLFYRGEVARALLAAAGGGGTLRPEDLAGYSVARRPPLRAAFEGAEIETNPPPSAGGLLVACALSLLDGLGAGRAETSADRRAQLVAGALETASEAQLAAAAEGGGATAAASLLDHRHVAAWRERVAPSPRARRGTTHLNVLDRAGNFAAATVSNGSGSGCLVPGTDVAVNNMLGEAELNRGGFHRWPTDVRLSSMMAPTVARWPHGRIAALGSGGSNRIPSAIAQVVINLIARGMDLEAAVAAPRLHVNEGRLSVERGFDPAEIPGTLARWPEHTLWDRTSMFFGGVHVVSASGGRVEAVGDSRRAGAAAVV